MNRTLVSTANTVRPFFTLCAREYHLDLGKETKIMGILNLSPDSFSGDGFLPQTQRDYAKLLKKAHRLIQQGADLIDVGGESSRPGSRRISVVEEIRRVIPVKDTFNT